MTFWWEDHDFWAPNFYLKEIIRRFPHTSIAMKAWHILLERHADRFLFGLDTYEPQRWLYIKRAMKWQRDLLNVLSPEVAKKIAFENGDKLIRLYDVNE